MLADADPRAVAVLASLRRVDPRLVLSEREAVRLAPAVTARLTVGLAPPGSPHSSRRDSPTAS